jgi:hypothetical protein
MTTRDYSDAYEDDSENVRSWPAQDAQEPDEWASAPVVKATCSFCHTDVFWQDCPSGGWWIHRYHPADDHEAVSLGLEREIERLTAEHDLALAAITRVEALATQWESLGSGHRSLVAQLLQALDEAALKYPRGLVE